MIFYIYGTDSYLCQEKVNELKNSFAEKKDKAGLNIIRLISTDKDFSFDQFSQEAMTVPFLSEKKLIIVENLCTDNAAGRKKLRDDVFNFLSTRAETIDNNLMFIDVFEDEKKLPAKDSLFGYLKKQKYSWYLPALKNRDLAGWLSKYCQTNNINLPAPALNELIVQVGNDLVQLTNELSKLKAYKNGEDITPEDVKTLVKAKYDSNAFRLTDALAAKNRPLALELLSQELLAGNEPLSLLGSINWQFKTLMKIKSYMEANPRANSAGISTATGLHSFVVSKNMALVKKFTLAELIAILNHLLELEKSLKFGHKNPELLFDMFVARYC